MIERGPVTIDQSRERYVDPRQKPIHMFFVEHDPRYRQQMEAIQRGIVSMIEDTDHTKKIAIIGENRSGIRDFSQEITSRFETGESLASIYGDLYGSSLNPFYAQLDAHLTPLQQSYPNRLTFAQEWEDRTVQRQGEQARRLGGDRTWFLSTYRNYYIAEAAYEAQRENNLAAITREVAGREDVGGVIEIVGAAHTRIGHQLKTDGYNVSRSFPNREAGPWYFDADDAVIRRQIVHPELILTKDMLREARKKHNQERRLQRNNPNLTHQQVLRRVYLRTS